MMDSKYSHYTELAGLSEVLRREQMKPHKLEVGREYVQFILDEPAERGNFLEIAIGQFRGNKEGNSSLWDFSNAISYHQGYQQIGSHCETENYCDQPVLLVRHNGRTRDLFLKPEYWNGSQQQGRLVPLESDDLYKILEKANLGEYVSVAKKEYIPSGMFFTPAGCFQKIIPDVNKVHAFLVSLENTLRGI